MPAMVKTPPPPLRNNEEDAYGQLHQLLWRTPASSPPAASAAVEPAALVNYIDVWMGNGEGRADVMDVDEDKSEPPSIRFIDLNEHPKLI
ncbi:hypothetical protein C8J57DRAFT_1523884 [Mycena rebaudengoi]|nr:hypothetical protein C8J57DRAFT_1523884 [Mycena rebaudengoi]